MISLIVTKFPRNCVELRNRMPSQWINYGIFWLCLWMCLIWMSHEWILYISYAVLAFYLVKWIRRAVKTVSPKTLISNTKKRVVFITGCDTGFGNNLAKKLDNLGFKIFAGCLLPDSDNAKNLKKSSSEKLVIVKIDVTDMLSINEAYSVVKEHCDKTEGCLLPDSDNAKNLKKSSSEKLVIVKIDVTDMLSINEAYSVVKEHCDKTEDRFWALVNNAGVATITEIEWCPVELYENMMNVNAFGVIRVTQTFLPLLRRCDGNRIVIVASLAGRFTCPGFSAYSMSKHAVLSFADGLRLEMKKWSISVHTVEPTLYNTPIINHTRLQRDVDDLWQNCSESVKRSYGKEYMEEFKSLITKQLCRAKPKHKVPEVIDSMIHAVAGETPECRYVPCFRTELKSEVLLSLPLEILDNLLHKMSPKTPPADVDMNRNHFSF